MQLIAPDIMEDVRGLSISLLAAGLLIGLVLWLTGWWGHRFWIVLAATITAGIGGMMSPPANRVQPVCIGLLLAVVAGMLALALVRLVAFLAGGIVAWLAVRALAPAGWDEPLLCFLIGGLFGLVLFRIWMMALTSFVGSVLMAYFGLGLADALGRVNALSLTKQQPGLLNWSCGAVALFGLIIQFLFDRKRMRLIRQREEQEYLAGRWPPLRYPRRWWTMTRWPSRQVIQ